MANISKVTLPNGNTYNIKDANVQETIAPVEETTTATVAHPLGSIFYFNDILYRAIEDISVGDTINTATGGNATQTTIAQNFKRTVTLTSAEYAQLSIAEKTADIVYIITDDNSIRANDVNYDHETSGASATNVQDALDEVFSDVRTRVPVNGMGKNLLHNWYFVGGGTGRGVFPVNQRGQSSYSGATSVFDGWTADTNTGITFGSAGITVSLLSGSSTNIYQRAGKAPLGQSITMSILTGNTLVSVSGVMPSTLPSSNQTVLTVGTSADGYRFRLYLQPAGTMYVEFRAYSTQTWVAAKLELGTEQTLAHQEGSTWVLNEIPNYEAELIKCQTSTADPSDIYANKVISTNVSKPNLLRNWYFVGGGTGRGVFPVNQRGQSSYSGPYSIDGWHGVTACQMTLASGYITTVSATYWQDTSPEILKLLLGKSVTASALLADGTLVTGTAVYKTSYSGNNVSSYDAQGFLQYGVTNSGAGYQCLRLKPGGYVAVKVEFGTEQTLAHQENGVWVLNEIPDYEYELYRCMTSTADPNDIYASKVIGTNVSNPNLLRNWYFVGGGTGRGVLPVNQRGFTTSSNVNHIWSIDGWWINGGRGTQTLNANGFYLSNTTTSGNTTIQQWVGTGAEYEGKVMTLSALSDIGLVTSTFKVPAKTSSDVAVARPYFDSKCSVVFHALSTSQPGYAVQFTVATTGSMTIKAVKLELGTEQTLAHQENGTWVLNEIPDYEAELIKCQTFTIENSDTYTNKTLATEQQIAYVENGTTASKAYVIGEYFCWNGLLYRAKTAIASGASFTVGTNCELSTVGDALAFTTYTGTQATNTVPGTSYTIINAVSLPSGKYLIVGSASNAGNISGTLALTITNATAGVNVVTNRTSTENGGGNTICAIIELSVTSTIRLRATQTTGSSLSLNTNSLTAVKLA